PTRHRYTRPSQVITKTPFDCSSSAVPTSRPKTSCSKEPRSAGRITSGRQRSRIISARSRPQPESRSAAPCGRGSNLHTSRDQDLIEPRPKGAASTEPASYFTQEKLDVSFISPGPL